MNRVHDLDRLSKDSLLSEAHELRDLLELYDSSVEELTYLLCIPRWFDEVLARTLWGEFAGRRPNSRPLRERARFDDAYKQVLALSIVEPFPGRGFNVHSLSRDALTTLLWDEAEEHYRRVSGEVVEYLLGVDSPIWEDVAEASYHLWVAEPEEAIQFVTALVEGELQVEGEAGVSVDQLDSLLQAHYEQVDSGRGSSSVEMDFYAAYASYLREDWTSVRRQATALLARDSPADAAIRAASQLLLGDADQAEDQLDAAEGHYRDALDHSFAIDDPSVTARAHLGLARLYARRDEAEAAVRALDAAIAAQVEASALAVDTSEDDEILGGPVADARASDWRRVGYYGSPDDEVSVDDEDVGSGIQIALYGLLAEPRPNGRPLLALETGELVVPFLASPQIASLWVELAEMEHDFQRFDDAAQSAELALQLFQDVGDPAGISRAAMLVTRLTSRRQGVESAAEGIDTQLRLIGFARETDDHELEFNATMNLAAAYEDADQPTAALEQYERALEIVPEDPILSAGPLIGLGRTQWIRGEFTEAEERFTQVANLYREHSFKWGNAELTLTRAALELDRGRSSEARALYETARREFEQVGSPRGQISALQGQATADTLLGDLESAAGALVNALGVAKEQRDRMAEASVGSQLGAVLRDQGRLSDARSSLAAALSAAQAAASVELEAELLAALAGVDVDIGSVDGLAARNRRLTELAKQSRDDPPVLLAVLTNLVVVESLIGEETPTMELLVQAAEELGGSDRVAQTLSLVANVMLDRDHPITALSTVRRGLARAPRNRGLLQSQIGALLSIGSFDTGLILLGKYERLHTMDAEACGSLGWALENLGSRTGADAAQAYEAALALNPNELWLLKGLANAQRLSGRVDDARETYQAVLDAEARIGSRASHSLYNQGWCLFWLGDFRGAAKMLRDSLDAPGGTGRTATLFDVALAHLAEDRSDLAEEAFGEALASLRHIDPAARRGRLYVALDDLQDARQLDFLAGNPGLVARFMSRIARELAELPHLDTQVAYPLAGDGISNVASAFNLEVDALQNFNGLSRSDLPGEVLRVPVPYPSPAHRNRMREISEQSLSTIAVEIGLSLAAIVAANPGIDPLTEISQVVRIPEFVDAPPLRREALGGRTPSS